MVVASLTTDPGSVSADCRQRPPKRRVFIGFLVSTSLGHVVDKHCLSNYLLAMIVGFSHKGLRRLYERGDRAGVRPDMIAKVERILQRLDEISRPEQ